MSAAFLLAAAVHWVGLSALAGLLGALVVELWVLPPETTPLGAARPRLHRWRLLCAVALIAATTGELVLRGRTMVAGDLASAVAAIPVILARTHFGGIWTVRLAALAVILLLMFSASRPTRAGALLLTVGVALTTSLTGHAADWGDLTASVGIDWLHVVASAAWAGGLMSLAIAALREPGRWPPEVLASVASRFSRLAGGCLLAVVLTGSYNAWVQVPRVAALWTTPYGRALAVKLLLVLALVWWGAVNRYTVVARLGPGHARGIGVRLFRVLRLVALGSARLGRGVLPSRLGVYVAREATLAALVFACTAVLVDSTPARHARHAQHGAAEPEPGAFRVTMAELHESGGVPKGWIFRPPPGDPKHGRELFERLGCFACHTVAGDKFPPSSGLGPELTGMGDHHPAGYLLESIINPNAVIVEGPGYTGPDGRSVMPSYAGRLSVSELIDLVAYLKSL
jgi:putative copper export protein